MPGRPFARYAGRLILFESPQGKDGHVTRDKTVKDSVCNISYSNSEVAYQHRLHEVIRRKKSSSGKFYQLHIKN
jgi:hypothetical protein